MNRITEANLQAVVDRINRMTNSPTSPYVGNKAQIGNYHLSHAYGGVCLHRMATDGGGVSSPLIIGHVPKRDLYHAMFAFIAGLNAAAEELKA
jgi:hypothetical protein